MSQEIMPYTFQTDVLPRQTAPQTLNIGQLHGVHITLAAEHREWILAKITRWFEGRDEIRLVDTGISDKHGIGYIILEWDEYQIDPLFIAILHEDELIADYTVYLRDLLQEEL